jgi:ATP-binding cassette subfamily C protein
MTEARAAARRLLADFHRFAGGRLWALAGVMLASAIAEGVGIVSLVPLLTISSGAIALPSQAEQLLSQLETATAIDRFFLLILLFLIAMTLRSLLLFARDALMTQLANGYNARLKLQAASSLARLGWAKASRVGLSGMQSLLLTDIPRCVHAVQEAQSALVAAILLTVQFGIAFYLSPAMALAAALLILAGIALSWRWLRAGHRRGVAITAFNESSSAASFRLHSGLKSAIAQGATGPFLREYERSLTHLSDEMIGFDRDSAQVRALAGVAAAGAAAILLIVGSQMLDLPIALLATVLILFARMSAPAQVLQQSAQGFAAYAPPFAAIEQRIGLLNPEEFQPAQSGKAQAWSQLRLTDVGFRHEEGEFALAGVTLDVSAGEWIGIAGPSGGGKTSLVDIVAALFEPQAGVATVDGEALAGARLAAWRAGLAYVGQNEMTFDDSIRHNLTAGTVGVVEEERLWAALETVGLAARIRSVGLDTQAGDRGSALSGGERQRLAIARALLRRPNIIILDEATNALDADAEEQVLRGLQALKPRPAVLLIAHRDRPLQLCDRIIRIEDGRQVAA